MEITLIFLLVAFSAYALFGGADFGGGILEATLRQYPHLQKKIQDTLAPVWEANHVWLIAVIVILFVGFPAVYAQLCTLLFVPISLSLLGIILRGAFFTFRKYDPEPVSRIAFYGFLFKISSALTPMMFGFIVAAMLGEFPSSSAHASLSFYAVYVAPWATLMGVLCALFVFALFAYVAAVFLFGELDNDADRVVIQKRIVQFFILTFFMGGVVLVFGATQGIVNLYDALTPVQIGVQLIALFCIPMLWFAIKGQRFWRMRFIAGVQTFCILTGWFVTQYPAFLKFADGQALTIYNSSAPNITLTWLNIGLVVVLLLVVPLLVYLYRVFRLHHEI